jgi:hypothetical protein
MAQRRSGPAAEQAARAHGEHDDEDDEADDFAVRAAERGGARRFRHAQHEAAHEGAHHRAEPGEDDDDQRLEGPFQPDGRADRIRHGHQRAGGAGQRRAEREGQEIGTPDVDTRQQRGLPVFRRRADRFAPAPAREQQLQRADQQQREHQRREANQRDRQLTHREHGAAVRGRDRALVGRPEPHGQRLQCQSQAEADQERILHARLFVRAHDEAEEPPVEDRAEHQRARDHQRQRGEGIDAEQRSEPEGAVAAEHDQLAVSDIQHAHDTEDQREPGRRQAVEPADQQAEQELLREHAHCRTASGPR